MSLFRNLFKSISHPFHRSQPASSKSLVKDSWSPDPSIPDTMTVVAPKPPAKPKTKSNLPCLLCLHGGGTSAHIFAIQVGRLQRALAKHFRFVFVDGPFICPPGPGVLPFFEGMGPYRRWINKDGCDEDKVRPLLKKKMAEDGGNFVGVLGFSQGARLALGLLHEKQEQRAEAFNEFGFGVFICGTYPPLGLSSALFPTTPTAQFETQYWDSKHDSILRIPTVHVMGDRDPFLHKSRLLSRCSDPASTSVMQFAMGHSLPVAPADTQRVANKVIALHENYRLEIEDAAREMQTLEKGVENLAVTALPLQT
ncbi:MAG: hypothetical protein L6R36_007300 [Xanthoria steineri]|nr:MAG: hypothetical protein L6R36_007300 [Xanthoria steineri]